MPSVPPRKAKSDATLYERPFTISARKFLVNVAPLLLQSVLLSFSGGSFMLKRLGYAALIGFTAVAFTLGSAATNQAQAKKKMAEPPPPPPIICPLIEKPVCGETMGVETTYHNWCFAAKSGAKIVHKGACGMHKAKHKAMKKMAKPAKKKEMKK
jgi:hypothetical protein